VTVLTNTPPRRAQSQPGGLQGIMLMEPVVAKAARQLGIDQVAIRRINAPEGKAPAGPPNARGVRGYCTSAFLKQALDRGAELFEWEARKARSGQRNGSKVRGAGVAVSTFVAGSVGFDGLFVIKPDGKMYVQSGIGNLGTESFSDTMRVAAEMMGVAWEDVTIAWGDTSQHLPWSCVSGGSQTLHAHTRAAHAAATDAIRKCQEIAAQTLGGRPESYRVADGRVSGNGRSMTLAQVAQKAIELGGKYDGHELPKDINRYTVTSATALAGQGLMGVARDSYPRDGSSYSFVAGFAEVEVDVETGNYQLIDYLAVADVGTVIHPNSLGGQVLGRSVLGMGHSLAQKTVYDQHYGVALAKRFYQNRPPTILDVPAASGMKWEALGIPDPETPVGARGIGEPPVAAGACAVMNAISAAVGDDVFRRAPITLDAILTALENGRPTLEPLTAHI
jgi:CO/xanthine dehydrogenase Mo-binding subunit